MTSILYSIGRRLLAAALAIMFALSPSVAKTRVVDAGIKELILAIAEMENIDRAGFLRVAEIESGLNPNAFNKDSRAAGIFQFIPGTARLYGLTDAFDPVANTFAAARLWKDNKEGLRRALGRTPTTGEIYLAHQQGLAGAIRLLGNPSKPAVSIVGSKAVVLNGGRSNMTAYEFAHLWIDKLD